jgi:fluoride ion exporter CrcB/FEX
MALSGNHTARIALLSVATILGILSLFLGWWVFHVEVEGAERDSSAKPFDAGDFADDDEDDPEGLDQEVIVTGILASLATLAVLAYLVLELLPAIGKAAQPLPRLVVAFISISLGLAAVLYTTFAWPDGAGGQMDFFDKTTFGGAPFGGDGSVSSYGGIGWWLAIASTILLPLATFLIGLRDPRTATPA